MGAHRSHWLGVRLALISTAWLAPACGSGLSSDPWGGPSHRADAAPLDAADDAPVGLDGALDQSSADGVPMQDGSSGSATDGTPSPPACPPDGRPVRAFGFAPDGQTLVLGRADGWAELRRSRDGSLLRLWRAHESAVTAISYLDAGSLVTGGIGPAGKLRFWRPASATLRLLVETNTGGVRTLGHAEDGTLIVASGAPGQPGDVTLRRPDTGVVVRSIAGAEGGDISQRAGGVVTWAADGVKVWGSDGSVRWSQTTPVRAAALSPDGDRVVLLDGYQVVLRPIGAGGGADRWQHPAPDATTVSFAADGARVIVGHPSGVTLLAAADGALLGRLTDGPSPDETSRVAASAGDAHVARLTAAGVLSVWSLSGTPADLPPSWRAGGSCNEPEPDRQASEPVATAITGRGECGSDALPEDTLARFGRVVMPAATRLMRLGVASPAFRECLALLMPGGGQNMPRETDGAGWGGYCPPDRADCGAAGPDPYLELTRHLADARRGGIYARRVASHGSVASAGSLSVQCVPAPAPDPDHRGAGTSFAPVLPLAPDRFAIPPLELAADLLHATLHDHGFHHATGAGSSRLRKRQVPDIAAACLREVLLAGAPAEQPGCQACSDGRHPVPAGFRRQGCTCVFDPAEHGEARLRRSWPGLPGTLLTVTANNDGEVFLNRVPDGPVFELEGDDWKELGVSGWVVPGGDTLLVGSGNSLVVRSQRGPFTDVGQPGDELKVDDVGTAYRRSASGLEQMLVDTRSWTSIPLPPGLTAEAVFTGGGELYVSAINRGGLFHYRRSGPTAGAWTLVPDLAGWHDLDAIGRMYGIPLGGGPLHQLREAGRWEIIAGATEEVTAGHRVFHRGPMSDRVTRLSSGGDLGFFSRCLFYTTGAESLYCVTERGVDVFDRN